MPNIHQIPIELRDQVLTILGKMAVLRDVDSRTIAGRSSKDAEGTGAPTGPTTRLFDHWADRFASEKDIGRLRILIQLAARDLALRTHAKPQHFLDESPIERDQRIIDWYRDIPADEAAIIEGAGGWFVTAKAIRQTRRRNDLDPDTGREVLSLEHEVQDCVRLHDDGFSQRKIAEKLSVSVGTVNKRLQQHRDNQRRLAA